MRNMYRSNNPANKFLGLAVPHYCIVDAGFSCHVPDRALQMMREHEIGM